MLLDAIELLMPVIGFAGLVWFGLTVWEHVQERRVEKNFDPNDYVA